MGKLTAVAVKTATGTGILHDGEGLRLQLRGKGKGSWIYRFQLKGRTREMGLGAYPEVTLAEARQRAADARKLTREGIDPIEAKKLKAAAEAPVKVPTFAEIAAEYIEAHKAKWKSDKSAARWVRFKRYATAAFGEKEVVAIDTDDVLKLLKPIWATKAETANKLREWLVGVFDAAKAKSKGKAWRFTIGSPAVSTT